MLPLKRPLSMQGWSRYISLFNRPAHPILSSPLPQTRTRTLFPNTTTRSRWISTRVQPISRSNLSIYSSYRLLSTSTSIPPTPTGSTSKPIPPQQQNQQQPQQQQRPQDPEDEEDAYDTTPPPRDLKALIREYGRVAVVTYLMNSFVFFCLCYASIAYFGFDAEVLLRKVKKVREWAMGVSDDEDGVKVVVVEEPSSTTTTESSETKKPNSNLTTTASTILLAMGMTKLFLPIKLMLTAALTPLVARRLRRLGFDVGIKKMRDIKKYRQKP